VNHGGDGDSGRRISMAFCRCSGARISRETISFRPAPPPPSISAGAIFTLPSLILAALLITTDELSTLVDLWPHRSGSACGVVGSGCVFFSVPRRRHY